MMDNKLMIMRTGAGNYIQGDHSSVAVGGELKRLSHCHVGILSGKRAFAAARETLLPGLTANRLSYEVSIYHGYCTAADIDDYARWAREQRFDCLLGVGGGKLMDLTKAVGAQAMLPVFTLPTVAATCAAFAPLSVLYDQTGHQETIRYHRDSVAGVFVDLSILADAPERYLAAGIADAFAKSCEYTSMRSSVEYGSIDFGRFIGARLALECDEVLHHCARQAYEDNRLHRVTPAFGDALSCLMGVIGVVSGFGAYAGPGGARFAIAHGFNEVIRARYVPDPCKYLHGEVVAVGIMAQLRANGLPWEDIERKERLFRDLNVPTRLSHIDMDYDDTRLNAFIDELLAHCRVQPQFVARVTEAVRQVR